jgi:hypothetical protein
MLGAITSKCRRQAPDAVNGGGCAAQAVGGRDAACRSFGALTMKILATLLPRDWPGLEWRIFRPAIKCGQQSLEVFCTGMFLSFAAHFVLVEISGAIWMQIVVSIVGILMMTALAYCRSWSKNADKAPTKIKPIVAAAG